MIWILLMFWGTKPDTKWIGLAFKTESQCRDVLRTITSSNDIKNNLVFTCREMGK